MTKLQQAIVMIENAQYMPPANGDQWYKLLADINRLLRDHEDDDVVFIDQFTALTKDLGKMRAENEILRKQVK